MDKGNSAPTTNREIQTIRWYQLSIKLFELEFFVTPGKEFFKDFFEKNSIKKFIYIFFFSIINIVINAIDKAIIYILSNKSTKCYAYLVFWRIYWFYIKWHQKNFLALSFKQRKKS